jgi:hypothetical protein
VRIFIRSFWEKEKTFGTLDESSMSGGIIAQHGGGIHKGFAYGWEENGAYPVNCLGAHFVRNKCILLSL